MRKVLVETDTTIRLSGQLFRLQAMLSPDWAASQIQAFKDRGGSDEAGIRFGWAARAVESLHYLDYIDREYGDSPPPGHRGEVVDVAHVRWATSTAITALDLCAAGLGLAFCGITGSNKEEMAVVWLDPKDRKGRDRKGKALRQVEGYRKDLPAAATTWVDDLLADPRYRQIKQIRKDLIHSWIPRHLTILAGGQEGRERVKMDMGGSRVSVRTVIENARDVADDHVTRLLDILPGL